MNKPASLETNKNDSLFKHELYPGEEVLWKGDFPKVNKKERLLTMFIGIALLVASFTIPVPICNMFEPFSAIRYVIALIVLFGVTIGMFIILFAVIVYTHKYVLTSYRLLCLDSDSNVDTRRSFDLKHISLVTEKENYLHIEFKPPAVINTPFVRFSRSINGYDILKEHIYSSQIVEEK